MYLINEDIASLLAKEGIKKTEYQRCYGNQLQQLVHQECINILDQTAQLTPNNAVHDYQHALTNITDSARVFNKIGNTHNKSLSLLDVC